jgi:hypothetical protein
VALSQKLPALLTQFQAEPAVVSETQVGVCVQALTRFEIIRRHRKPTFSINTAPPPLGQCHQNF